MAYERTAESGLGASVLVIAQAAVRRIGTYVQALGGEISRIPHYQDEAREAMQGLRRRHANSRGRDRREVSDA